MKLLLPQVEVFLRNYIPAVEIPSCEADALLSYVGTLIENGFINLSEKPGLGFDDLNEDLLREHINPKIPGLWEPTDQWNTEFSNDRIWS